MEWGQVFPLAPSVLKTGWLTALFGGLLILWVGLFFFLTHMISGAASADIALRGGMLTARGGFFGRDIPLSEVDAVGAFRFDLGDGGPKALRWRTNGVGLPGLAAGWFRLADGEKALAFVTDKSRAVYVPTCLGYALVVSPADPDGFLDALRRATPGGTGAPCGKPAG
ncbi:MAG: PH domain-containing protein [Acidobacteriota bacterium]